jgi:hypothetical protein
VDVVSGVVGGIVCLAVRWLIYTLLWAVVEDDGSYCLRCGYQIGVPAIDRCPECGVARDKAEYRLRGFLRAFDESRRLSHPLLVALLALACVAISIKVYRGWAVERFLARFGALMGYENQAPGRITVWSPDGQEALSSTEANGALVRLDGFADRVLIVRYAVHPPRHAPLMQITLGTETSSFTDRTVAEGAPLVFCDLVPEQAEYVVRRGIPDALVQEFNRVAEISGWTSPWAPTRGSRRPPNVRISPDAFFPPRNAGRGHESA